MAVINFANHSELDISYTVYFNNNNIIIIRPYTICHCNNIQLKMKASCLSNNNIVMVAIVKEVAKCLVKLILPTEQPYGYDHQMKSVSLIH